LDQDIFTAQDIRQIRDRGMTPEMVLSQLQRFKKGFPFAKLKRPCTLGDGIISLGEEDIQRLSSLYTEAALSGRVMKFVPASGAATRMFKSLLAVHNRYIGKEEEEKQGFTLSADDPDERAFRECLEKIDRFAFFQDLKAVLSRDGLRLEGLIREKRYDVLLDYLLTNRGLNLARLPKGLIPFHVYPDHTRTPFQEHLVESAAYTKDRGGRVLLHFTVSREHEAAFLEHCERVRTCHEDPGTSFKVTFSIQKPSTDTIAADLDNRPFRDDEGALLFRPGGHGALLENLSEIRGDIVFIKNIDNVVPDRLKEPTFTYKKALGGYLLELQGRVFKVLDGLSQGAFERKDVREMVGSLREELALAVAEDLEGASRQEQVRVLLHYLNRPLRVCGMVKNVSEPGGGPFWVEHSDGSITRQIVEASQVDMESKEQRAIWESSTHFNPVDLVCGVRNHKGKPFDLMAFRDPETGFISRKSYEGRELKALELPGLWNGGMAQWNTVFVEVPLVTFNPVKTLMDLLRKEHQPE